MLMDSVNALALWYSERYLKCVSRLAKTRKNLNFLRCMHVFELLLKKCSDKNERNWGQLLFNFIVLMVIVSSNWELLFFIFVSVFNKLMFFRITVLRKCLQGDPKIDLIKKGLMFLFLLKCVFLAFSGLLPICMDYGLKELFNIVSLATILSLFDY